MRLNERQAKILDEMWGTGRLFELLLRFARAGHDPQWWRTYIEYEVKATQVRTYSALLVPGLLQTPDYARALLVAGHAVDDVEAAVEARMIRQEILNRPKPAQLWALLAQGALQPPVGGPEVMRAQLAHLVEMSNRPDIFLRVIPTAVGAHVALEGSFNLMTNQTSGNAAYMEAVGGGRLSLDGAEWSRLLVRFDRIGADSLSRDSSRGLIAQMMEAMT